MSTATFEKLPKRSHYCGELTAANDGAGVTIMGWVDTRRDHGGLIFIDLRDRKGLVQVVINPEGVLAAAKDLRNEWVVAIKGSVRKRPEGMINKNLGTGEIEIEASQVQVLSEAETPPIGIGDQNVTEALRLKYRYLDLRSETLQNYIITRHKTMQIVRKFLSENDCIEVETPILYKSTPEGARDYLVPSRVNQGQFYALPQSPQTLKQLLMIGGMDRYFQLCRCFRDEDLRADRQPEFSQIDIEMSFVDADDVMAMQEQLVKVLWQELKGATITEFPRMTFHEAMSRYGTDKPDLRNPLELGDISDVVKDCGFKVFDETVARGDVVKSLAIEGAGDLSRAQLDKLTTLSKQMGAKGLVWIKSQNGELASPIAKFFEPDKFSQVFEAAGGKEGGIVFLVADQFEVSCAALSALRTHFGKERGLIDKSSDRFMWVTDFPLFEYSAEEKRWVARHHPFTTCIDDDLEKLVSGDSAQFGELKAKAYDLVCNGYELAGGSVRIHRQNVQAAMFKALGFSEEEVKRQFGFFIEALKYGTPPHGGVAWGLDRLVMLICGTDAIRDVIAFPKTAKATDLMAETPSKVAPEQLLELGVRLSPQAEKSSAES
jgi:aspartyl-tRNA synthetase